MIEWWHQQPDKKLKLEYLKTSAELRRLDYKLQEITDEQWIASIKKEISENVEKQKQISEEWFFRYGVPMPHTNNDDQ